METTLINDDILTEVETSSDSVEARVSDVGLHFPLDKANSNIIYGVLPYVAPEVLRGNPIKKASDIFSFGIIMWTLSAGIRPWCNRPHDLKLASDICSGLRPEIIDGTPNVYTQLMTQCWDPDPSKRPTASELNELLGNLNTAGEFQGKVAAKIGRIGAGFATAGGESIDNAKVAPNAGGGFPVVIIAPNIKLGQLLYLFRTAYITVEYLKQMAVFGQLMQDDMTVEQFSANIKKIGKLGHIAGTANAWDIGNGHHCLQGRSR
ncbi:20647_t:CDS:2 [Funneliformis geosporum]|nr:20647_t:CDS:2 [Funneliformis geosporum]